MLSKIILSIKIALLVLFQYFCISLILIFLGYILWLLWFDFKNQDLFLNKIISFIVIFLSIFITTFFATKLLKKYMKIDKKYFKIAQIFFILSLLSFLLCVMYQWFINIIVYSQGNRIDIFIENLFYQWSFFIIYLICLHINFKFIK